MISSSQIKNIENLTFRTELPKQLKDFVQTHQISNNQFWFIYYEHPHIYTWQKVFGLMATCPCHHFVIRQTNFHQFNIKDIVKPSFAFLKILNLGLNLSYSRTKQYKVFRVPSVHGHASDKHPWAQQILFHLLDDNDAIKLSFFNKCKFEHLEDLNLRNNRFQEIDFSRLKIKRNPNYNAKTYFVSSYPTCAIKITRININAFSKLNFNQITWYDTYSPSDCPKIQQPKLLSCIKKKISTFKMF